MSSSHPTSNNLKLSEQRWYQNSSNNMSMYMDSNSFGKSHSTELTTNYATNGIPLIQMTGNDKAPTYRKPSNMNISEAERLLPELLVMEIHRDGNMVTYRHYTIRALYRYVLDAIADRTGILQAGAYYQLWHKKATEVAHTRTGSHDTELNPQNVAASTHQVNIVSGNQLLADADIISGNADHTSWLSNSVDGTNISPAMRDSTGSASMTTNTNSNDPMVGQNDNPTDQIMPPSESSNTADTSEAAVIPHISPSLPPSASLSASAPQPMNLGISHSSTHNAQPNASATGATNNNYNVTYRERLGGYLHPRDMRRLVTPFSTSNEPEIIVRRHAILINYDPLRTIILRDRLLVLVPNGADSLLSKLESRVRGSREDMENTIFGKNVDQIDINNNHSTTKTDANTTDKVPFQAPATKMSTSFAKSRTDRPFLNKKSTSNVSNDNTNVEAKTSIPNDGYDNDKDDETNFDEWNEMAAREWVNLPFELQCTDAVLYVVGSILDEETIEVQQAAQTFIERIVKHGGSGLEDDPLTIIRVVKDAVQLMSNRVKSYVQSIHRLLDDDEDMALMNLSRLLTHPERFVQPVPQRILNEESDEPELILESNLQVGLTLVNYLEVIQGQIHTAKELIDQRLDATRNKLLFANMLISVFTLCVTLGTLVGSFFGMNLEFPRSLQENDFAFNQVVAYTCIGCIVICILIMIALLYTDTIPFRLSRRFRPVRINV